MTPASSTPVGPPPITAKVISARRRSGFDFGPLERQKDATADLGRVFERLQARGDGRPVRVAGIGGKRPRGDHQRIMGDWLCALDDFRQTNVLQALKEMTDGIGPDAVIVAVGMEALGFGLDAVLDRMKQ